MTDKAALTQKDIELVDKVVGAAEGGEGKAAVTDEGKAGDKGAADAGAKGEDKSAAKGAGEGDEGKGDKAAKEPAKRSASLFDDLDDDDDEGSEGKDKSASDEGKGGDKDAAKKPASEGKDASADEGKDEGKKPSGEIEAWRNSLADKLLAGRDTELTAAKLKKARDGILSELSRYKTPEEYMAAGFAARQKIRSGEYKTAAPGEGASEAEVKAWRKQNDIPDEPTGYELPKIDGYAITEADQPIFDGFRTAAHSAHISRKQAESLLKWHADIVKEQNIAYEEQMGEQDAADREAAADDLRNRFGVSDYKPRMRALDRLLKDTDVLPDGRGDRLREARYYDKETKQWRKLINDPYVAALLMHHAELEYGDIGFTPTQDVVKSKGRITELEELRSKDYDAYMRPGKDGKSAADELLELKTKESEREARRGRRSAA